jgi:peroxiredoxin
MPTQKHPDLFNVDWSTIPVPADDGGADHLTGAAIASVTLASTDGVSVSLNTLRGLTVVFAYPRTGQPGKIALDDGWDMIPGARGCTPQSCAFRDLYAELKSAGVAQVFGLSTQDTAYQHEAVERLHLPFALLSDEGTAFTRAMHLPTMVVASETLIKRLTMVMDEGVIKKVWYPVFPPDQNAADVLAWLRRVLDT